MSAILKSPVNTFGKLLAINDTSAAFPARIATTTKPSGANVFSRQAGAVIENNAILIPFGAGADNTTFDMRVIGWETVSNGTLWVPVALAQYSCTLCAAVGVAGSDLIATDRFADTITAASWNPAGGTEIVSPTGDLIGSIIMDMKAFTLYEINFDMTGGTSGNCLLKWL